MINNQKGLSLVEILISLVISSIIIAASFASYVVISRNFDFQKEMKNIAQSSRAVVEIIKRDVRLAGFVYDGNTAIAEPIKITDGGASASDRIDIIYDQEKNKRLKISYYTVTVKPMTAFERRRLMKTVIQCTVAQCGSGNTIMAPQPIADYVEDLQFTGFKNGNTLGNGAVVYGQGNMRWVVPQSVTANCGTNISNIIDGNTSTFWQCNDPKYPRINVNFATHVRIERIVFSTAAHVNGGSIGSNLSFPFPNASYPYGKSHNINALGEFHLDWHPHDITCAWSSSCQNFSSKKDITINCTDLSGEIDFLNNSFKNGCIGSNSKNMHHWASKKFWFSLYDNSFTCRSTKAGDPCNPASTPNGNKIKELAEIRFYGEVFGEPQAPQEVEIGLLIRSANEYGSTPVSRTYNIGNRTIATNDNYIRDAYFTSTLIRNVFYGQ